MDTFTAHIEWLTPVPWIGVIRVFEPGKGIGDQYVFVATIRITKEPQLLEIIGTVVGPTIPMKNAMKTALLDAGFTEVLWDRREGDGWRQVRRKLKRVKAA